MSRRGVAIDYLNRRAFAWAEKELKAWLEECPDDHYAHTQLVRCFHERGDMKQRWCRSSDFYGTMFSAPNRPLVCRLVACEQAYYRNDMEACLRECQKAVAQGLDVVEVWHRLAVAARGLGRHELAEEGFETTIRLDPGFLPAIEAYGDWLLAEGRFGRVEQLGESLESPDNGPPYNFADAENALARMRGRRKACRSLRRAVELFSGGSTESAALTLWPAFREHGKNCPFISAMACLFYRSNWWAEGKLRLTGIVGKDDPHAAYLDGLVAWYEGDHEKSLGALERALNAGLDHPLVHFAKAVVLLHGGGGSGASDSELAATLSRHPWFVCARAVAADRAMERSDYDCVISTAQLEDEDRECALRYDLNGFPAVARLDSLALEALMNTGMVSKALERAEADRNPLPEAALQFRRAMVFAAAGKTVRACRSLGEALNANCGVLRTAAPRDAALIEALPDHQPTVYEAHLAKALLYGLKDNARRFRKRFRELADCFPEQRADAFAKAGVMAEVSGKMAEGKHAYHQSLRFDACNEQSIQGLRKLLEKDRDMAGLLALAKQLPAEAGPLESALKVAKELQDPAQVGQIARRVLKVAPDNLHAAFLLSTEIDADSVEYLRLLDTFCERNPFDFERRFSVAYLFLAKGMREESAGRFESLLTDGFRHLPAVFLAGIASLPRNAKE